MSSGNIIPLDADPVVFKGQGLHAFTAPGAPHEAGGEPEPSLDATIEDMRMDTPEGVPELFITLQVSWNRRTQEVVLGESDRYFSIFNRPIPNNGFFWIPLILPGFLILRTS
jgi:hypothetical protein